MVTGGRGVGFLVLLFRFARQGRPSCLVPVFLVPSDLKAGRREGVLRQQEAAQVWDPAFPGHVGLCGLLITEALASLGGWHRLQLDLLP